MLSVVILSVGATFAADVDDTLAVDDEITIDNALAAEETPAVGANESSIVITNDTFYNYFDNTGGLKENVTPKEIIFEGTFENLNLSDVVIERNMTLTGKNATFNNLSLDIYASNVNVTGFTFNQANGVNAIFVYGSDVTVSDSTINYFDNGQGENIAIQVIDSNNFKLLDNVINYVGNTTGLTNIAVQIKNSNGTQIKRNKINASLVSAQVPWAEYPSGSGIWVSSPISEGILIAESDKVEFEDNNIDVTYNNVLGTYDTIYSVDFDYVNNAIIKNNTITSSGHSYIYGIIITGDNFTIVENKITSVSDNYYANGIDIEGPATGVVKDNVIDVRSPNSVYAVYSGMNGFDVNATYIGNNITANAYNVFGFSLGDVESELVNNTLVLNGNYTTGIAYHGNFIVAKNNRLYLNSSEQGNESISESFGVESVGVKVTKGSAMIMDNVIAAAGKGVSLITNGTTAYLSGNFINVVAHEDMDAYAIYATDIPYLSMVFNDIDYQGATNGTAINNGIFVSSVGTAIIDFNDFVLDMVSSYVPWFEVPIGSGNWVSFPISEGIVIEDSNCVSFANNTVELTCGDVVGSYDTIYAVSFKNSDNAEIKDNKINASGHTYIYGIQVKGNNFTMADNIIKVKSDIFYANAIDIEGPATGVVEDNVIDVQSPVSAYAVYSGMNGADVYADYIGNNITANAYNVFGFSLGDVESELENNTVDLNGNYTTGIAYYGNFIVVKNNKLYLISSEQGNESVWESFGVESVGVKVTKGSAMIMDNVIATAGKGVSLITNGTTAYLSGNFINVVAHEDMDAYAIYATDIPYLSMVFNDIDYQGATNGTAINNGIFVSGVDTVIIDFNDFVLDMVSSYVPWFEVPIGSGNWVSFPISEGIVIEDSNCVSFANNTVELTCGDVVGSYDTIYAVSFKNSDNAEIKGNKINALGHTYIYGIQISGNNFTIADNAIDVASDIYYANGIDIEGPATGVVDNNVIVAKGIVSAYPIYSGMNGQPVSVIYTNNNISGEAYLVIGMSLGDAQSDILNNKIDAKGNYTMGIASVVSKLVAKDNIIIANASNVGNESIWETFGVQTVGINIAGGNPILDNNTITSTGEDIKLSNVVGTIIAEDIVKAYNAAYSYKATFIGLNGKPMANTTFAITVNGNAGNYTTDENGAVVIAKSEIGSKVGTYTVSSYNPDTNETLVNTIKLVSRFSGNKNINMYYYDGTTYKVRVYDDNGNPVGAKEKVVIKINGKPHTVQTDKNGYATYKIVEVPKSKTYTITATYKGQTVKNTVKVKQVLTSKKTVTVKKSAKKLVLSATLKKGKTAIKNKKVSFKLNGKTYSGKTNSKGVAKVTIKKTAINKLKAGKKYTVKVTYVKDTIKTTLKVKK